MKTQLGVNGQRHYAIHDPGVSQHFFSVGGTLDPRSHSYVERDCDSKLFSALAEGELVHLRAPRQMGKSSVFARATNPLRDDGVTVAAVDLSGLGQNLSPEQYYAGLIGKIGAKTELEDELQQSWEHSSQLGACPRFFAALKRLLVKKKSSQIIIGLDEIDSIRSLKFTTDEFFDGIRDLYNSRSVERELRRLTFCLIGVSHPSALISGRTQSVFNVGQKIELRDFTFQECDEFKKGLRDGIDSWAADQLFERIYYWTDGHPYLTQRLCKAAVDKPSVTFYRTSEVKRFVDTIVEELFIDHPEQDDNLVFVQREILGATCGPKAALKFFHDICRARPVEESEADPLQIALRTSGLTLRKGKGFRVRNRIYGKVFDTHWILRNMELTSS